MGFKNLKQTFFIIAIIFYYTCLYAQKNPVSGKESSFKVLELDKIVFINGMKTFDINEITAIKTGEQIKFNIKYASKYPGRFSLFNPPDGDIILLNNPSQTILKGNGSLSIEVPFDKLKNTDIISLGLWLNENKYNEFVSFKTNEIFTELGIALDVSKSSDKKKSNILIKGKLSKIPVFDPKKNDPFQVDLRGYDLSGLNLGNSLKDLMYADFDTKTKWGQKLPEAFNPAKIMETGKNPGLKVRELHKKGIKGKNIGIAIIDQKLFKEHQEYAERLKIYEEIHCLDNEPQMHGSAVSSIALGKTIGVAPEADLYYIAETHGEYNKDNSSFDWNFSYVAKSINRILEINKTLPQNKKIKVISISVGWTKNKKGYQEVMKSVKNAEKESIFVISTSLSDTHSLYFSGLGRYPLDDPDDYNSYKCGLFWENSINKSNAGNYFTNILLVPMDSRTTAGYTDKDEYVFYNGGGLSWAVPYISGLYALACQVKPDITPQEFWKTALETGNKKEIKENDFSFELKAIVNPIKLIEALEK